MFTGHSAVGRRCPRRHNVVLTQARAQAAKRRWVCIQKGKYAVRPCNSPGNSDRRRILHLRAADPQSPG